MAGDRAHLLKRAGFGSNEPLRMDSFSGALYASRYNRVVFHESHDEAGNAGGTARTIVVAVNDAPLFGATRTWAEARARVCCGLSLLSARTPMFFMGEEIGAERRYTYNNFMAAREDIIGERHGNGRAVFRFYQDLITLVRRLRSIRTQNIDIVHQSNANRVVAFKRWTGDEELLVAASLNDAAFADGYILAKDELAIPDAGWKEIFNSDSAKYGGPNIGNLGAVVGSNGGRLNVVIPAAGSWYSRSSERKAEVLMERLSRRDYNRQLWTRAAAGIGWKPHLISVAAALVAGAIRYLISGRPFESALLLNIGIPVATLIVIELAIFCFRRFFAAPHELYEQQLQKNIERDAEIVALRGEVLKLPTPRLVLTYTVESVKGFEDEVSNPQILLHNEGDTAAVEVHLDALPLTQLIKVTSVSAAHWCSRDGYPGATS